MTTMKEIISQVNLATPRSKLVGGLRFRQRAGDAAQEGFQSRGHDDRRGSAALDARAQVADVGQFQGRLACSLFSAANFSTGNDSPVRLAWMRNRSLHDSNRTSAGIMSPAESSTTSPGTRLAIGSSRGCIITQYGRFDADHRSQLGGGCVGPHFLDEA